MLKLRFTDKDLRDMYQAQATFERGLNLTIELTKNHLILALNYSTNALLKTLDAWKWWEEEKSPEAYDTILSLLADTLSVYFASVYYSTEVYDTGIYKIYLDRLKITILEEEFSDAEVQHIIEWFSLEKSIMAMAMTQLLKTVEHYYPELNKNDIMNRFFERLKER